MEHLLRRRVFRGGSASGRNTPACSLRCEWNRLVLMWAKHPWSDKRIPCWLKFNESTHRLVDLEQCVYFAWYGNRWFVFLIFQSCLTVLDLAEPMQSWYSRSRTSLIVKIGSWRTNSCLNLSSTSPRVASKSTVVTFSLFAPDMVIISWSDSVVLAKY